jgi:putative FmdB family regulatory protein
MPTYGYECTACTDQFEIVQSVKDNPLTLCEKCGGNLRKLIYPIGIAFKGAGFYVNDYAAKPVSSTSGTTDSKPETSAPAATEAKTETKSEAKSDSTATPAATPTPAA